MRNALLLVSLLLNGLFVFSQNPEDEFYCATEIELHKGYKSDNARIWPSQIIPYHITAEADAGRNVILRGISKINAKTNVCLVPKKRNELAFINFLASDNSVSTSTLGYRDYGTTIRLNLSNGGSERTLKHEILHSLGFLHEHQRPDRDDYIVVNLENIQSKYTYAFDKRSGTISSPYDYASIMHYSSTAFSKNGSKTLRAKNGNEITYSQNLTESDIQDINYFYPKKLDCDSLLALLPPKPNIRIETNYESWCNGHELRLFNDTPDKENYQSFWEISNSGTNLREASTSDASFVNVPPSSYRISLTITNEHGSSLSTRNVNLEEKNLRVRIKPNPVEDELLFTVEGEIRKMEYSIWNLSGKRLLHQEVMSSGCNRAEKIDVTNIGSGVFVLQVKIGEEILIKRFVRQ